VQAEERRVLVENTKTTTETVSATIKENGKTILDKIITEIGRDLEQKKRKTPVSALKERIARWKAPLDFASALSGDSLKLIAEVKKASPSKGILCQDFHPVELAKTYARHGAAAISVLTEVNHFQGSLEYLAAIREEVSIPLLRKDFILDQYQVAEARAYGAGAFLLIAACLEADQCRSLIEYGREISLEALVEIHNPYELDVAVDSGARLLGVNNRNLKTFEVDINTSFEIARRLEGEDQFVLVAESGVSHRSEILELKDAGFQGFLIGTAFMESDDPGAKLRELTHGE